MIVIILSLLLLLFSISLCLEIVNLDFTIELRPMVFAVLVCALITKIGLLDLWNDGLLGRLKQKITSLDVAYIATIFLTIFSFVTKSQSINALHFVFTAFGMLGVYFFIRVANSDKILLQSKIIYSVVGIGFVVAVIGLIQFAMGKPLVSTFGRTSYLGCFLAMNVPLVFGMVLANLTPPRPLGTPPRQGGEFTEKIPLNPFIKGGVLIAFVVILGVTILTKSRTAMIPLAVVLPLMIIATKSQRHKEKSNDCQKPKTKLYKKIRRVLFLCLGVLVALFFIFNIGKIAYKLKPMSASGRVLIWKVSAEMFRKNPISGVGVGNFANYYNFYQADYLASGKGSVINKITAGQIRHAYNWYLETAAEFGMFGLIVFGIFWWLILVEVYKVFTPPRSPSTPPRQGGEFTGHGQRASGYVTLGMAGAVLCFMIMSLFQFPRKIIPTYLMFNVALAWIVNANLEENSKAQMINNKQIPKEEN